MICLPFCTPHKNQPFYFLKTTSISCLPAILSPSMTSRQAPSWLVFPEQGPRAQILFIYMFVFVQSSLGTRWIWKACSHSLAPRTSINVGLFYIYEALFVTIFSFFFSGVCSPIDTNDIEALVSFLFPFALCSFSLFIYLFTCRRCISGIKKHRNNIFFLLIVVVQMFRLVSPHKARRRCYFFLFLLGSDYCLWERIPLLTAWS